MKKLQVAGDFIGTIEEDDDIAVASESSDSDDEVC